MPYFKNNSNKKNEFLLLSLLTWRQEQKSFTVFYLNSIETEWCLPVFLKFILQALWLYPQIIHVCLFRMWLLLIKTVLIECLCHEWLVACLKLHASIYMTIVYFLELPVQQYWEITKGFLLFSWVILKDIAVILDYWHCCLGIKP